ncbi:EscI/YscI/HrpB family type III secretion system inner rod protein [Burkholderia sp. Nafp2/4-1b]|uniref:type III secretion system inner rod subunit SctI n=1 Tax=Burkholderia sp. Nafp2/4-1b TaxID=2116686 RepID=UPI000EF95AA4|nr:type III secretion system inner rod subunit SctI [Burkholderia sp. Nafp2/4-1b]RKT98760.1 EscI/YscI/HrpB family type III secretion system inner rod protein [Burkholderia sp. Nafp2/4-1b]
MEITAAQRALQVQATKQESGATPPDHIQIEAFTRALFGQDASTPEAQAAIAFHDRAIDLDRAIKTVRDRGSDALMQPLEMLANQSAMLHAILEVDLVAKVAGSVSQGINKLVNMQ